MSDDESVVEVDKDGHPVVDEGRPTAALHNVTNNSVGKSYPTVIDIDDDSSVETTLVIGASGRKTLEEDVLIGQKNDGVSDKSPVPPEEIEEGMEDGSENPVRLTASAIAKNCEWIAQGEFFGPQARDETSGNGLITLEDSGENKPGTNSSIADTSREGVEDDTSREGVENTASLSKEALDNIMMSTDSFKDTRIPNFLLHRERPRCWYGFGERTGSEVASLPQIKLVTTAAQRQVCEDSSSDEGILEEWNSLPLCKPVTTAAERQVCEDSSSDEGILEEWNRRKMNKNSSRADRSGDIAKDAEEMDFADWFSSNPGERSIRCDESNDSFTQNDVASLDDHNPLKTVAINRKRTVARKQTVAPNQKQNTSSSQAESDEATPLTDTTTFLKQQNYSVIGKNRSVKTPMKTAAPKLDGRPPRKYKPDETTEVTSSRSVRSRVYAKWINGEYFWGSITAISGDYYSILFDDGDFLEQVRKKDFATTAYMEAALQKTPPPLDRKTAKLVDDLISGKASMSAMKLPKSPLKLTVAGMNGICGNCENCREAPCGRCAWCRSDGNSCLQKMCYEVPVDVKAEPAVGFPPGWRFLFADAYQHRKYSLHVPCLRILSPGGRIFCSVEAAVNFCKLQNGEMVAHKFYAYVGLPQEGKRTLFKNLSKRSRVDEEEVTESRPRKNQRAKQSYTGQTKTSIDHVLVGRSFCLKWMDLNKQKKVIYGKVAEYEYNTRNRDIISFKVTFNTEMREVLNRIGTGCESKIQAFQMFDPIWTWGGCVLAEQEQQGTSDRSCRMLRLPPIYYSWLTPDVSIHSMAERGGTRFPCLIVFYRGCRLQFDVKPSRIPNSGNGVFLSCTRDDDKSDSFTLKNGELLDLGIYAPLRNKDLGLKAIFLVKNFIHHYKIEDYAFSHTDSRYHIDISDDISGDLHAGAKSQIFPFVNENVDDLSVTVRPTPDPEGFLHYHLGHSTKGQGDFEVPTDGREVELYANYGHEYEKVRIRKGYSKLSEEDRAGVLELQDAGYLEVMDEFEESDVKSCVNFLSELFSAGSEIAPEVRQRALTCAVVLQRRAWHLLLDNDSEEVNITEVWCSSRNLVAHLLRNDELEELHHQGKWEEVMRRVFERHAFSEEGLNEVAYMLE